MKCTMCGSDDLIGFTWRLRHASFRDLDFYIHKMPMFPMCIGPSFPSNKTKGHIYHYMIAGNKPTNSVLCRKCKYVFQINIGKKKNYKDLYYHKPKEWDIITRQVAK